jgi:hypothetical protein
VGTLGILCLQAVGHTETVLGNVVDVAPVPGGWKWPTKIEKSLKLSRFEVLDVHFWGLKASPAAKTSFMEV